MHIGIAVGLIYSVIVGGHEVHFPNVSSNVWEHRGCWKWATLV